MKNPWLLYSLIRVGTFAVLLVIMLALNFDPFYATFISAVLALAISLIFFNKQRDDVTKAIYEKRHAQHDKDSKTEDDLLG